MKNCKRSAIPLLAMMLGLSSMTCPLAVETDAKQETKTLPTPRQVVASHVQALGGEEALTQYSSMQLKGKFIMAAQGISAPMKLLSARPNKLLLDVTIPGLGAILTGYDGEVGWNINPATGPTLMEGILLKQTAEDGNFLRDLYRAEDYLSMETVGISKFNGRPCVQLKMVSKGGLESQVFFDEKTGLVAGTIATQQSMFGPVKATTEYNDFKEFGGVQIPTRVVVRLGGIEQSIAVESIEWDKIEATAFDLPADIKTLLSESEKPSAPDQKKADNSKEKSKD